MRTSLHTGIAAAVLAATTISADALILNIDYSYDANGFFADQARRDTLQAAASYFENLIIDDLTAITSGGVNQFDAIFSNPASGANEVISGFSVAADTLTVFAGGRALGGSALGIGGPGGFGASGTSAFINNAATRGETGDTQGPSATDFAPWGGSITFDTSANWYFDSDTTTTEPFSGNDFFSVALHELGHLLGIGVADSWTNLIDGTDFTGAASAAVYGGDVPLYSTGHWANGVNGLVDGVTQEAAMTPSILTGTRKVFTDLDNAGLQDVGWELQAVPVPAAVWLFGSGLLALAGIARRKTV